MSELARNIRDYRFHTRVKKQWLAQLKKIAYEEDIKYVEVLERSLDFYDKQRERKVGLN
jgi:hypothetical protein